MWWHFLSTYKSPLKNSDNDVQSVNQVYEEVKAKYQYLKKTFLKLNTCFFPLCLTLKKKKRDNFFFKLNLNFLKIYVKLMVKKTHPYAKSPIDISHLLHQKQITFIQNLNPRVPPGNDHQLFQTYYFWCIAIANIRNL